MDAKQVARFVEFLVIGSMMGVTEDITAINVATDAEDAVEMIGNILVVALPFAGLSELLVDNPAFGDVERLVERSLTEK